ncbi:MAG: hypothetical protein KDA72_06430 [Planctomycetales bacterium]|nr:hypothetical protein [Planctomycetales bacterium]
MRWRSGLIVGAMCVFAIFSTSFAVHASEETALRDKIVAAHKSLKATIIQGMGVTYSLTNTYAAKTKKTLQPLDGVRHIIKGEQTLLIKDAKISGSNSDYSFQVADEGGKFSLLTLESRRSPSERIQAYESSRRAILSSSISIFEHEIVELFRNSGTKDLSVVEENNRVIVRFVFAPPGGEIEFSEVELELDPNNMYQLVKCRDVMTVLATNDQYVEEGTFVYEDEFLNESKIRLLRRSERTRKYTNREGKPDEDLQLNEFADWSQVVPDDSKFRLAGYGLPEPNPAALNAGTNWLRWTLICLVAGLGVVLLFFGKRISLLRS